jgi:hypothetical protein
MEIPDAKLTRQLLKEGAHFFGEHCRTSVYIPRQLDSLYTLFTIPFTSPYTRSYTIHHYDGLPTTDPASYFLHPAGVEYEK